MLRIICALVLASGWLQLPAADDALTGIGYRWDGSGVFPVRDVPTRFDPASGEGVRWKTALPNFALASPIVVGDRVYVMSERSQSLDPGHLFPTLICLDADSGEILWQTEIDHLPVTAGNRADEIRAAWRQELIAHATMFRVRHLVNDEKSMAVEEGKAALEELGWQAEVSRKKGGLYGKLPRKGERERLREMLEKEHNLYWSNWHRSGKWGGPHIAHSFPTPVSDGENIYVVTGFSTAARVGADGDIDWLRVFEPQNTGRLSARYVPSPLIVDGILLTTVDYRIRALDLDSGKTLWEIDAPWPHGYACGSPIPLRIDDQWMIFTTSGHLVRVRDGRIMASGVGFQGSGHPPTGTGGDTVFFTNQSEGGKYRGSGKFQDEKTYAVRFVPGDGDAMQVEQLWSLSEDEKLDNPIFVEGRLYGDALRVFDPANGKQTGGCKLPHGGKPNQAWVATPRYLVSLAASGKEGPGLLLVVDIGSGSPKVVAEGELPQAPAEGAKREQRLAEISRTVWSHPANTVPFLTEGRIYVRTMDDLWCIGR